MGFSHFSASFLVIAGSLAAQGTVVSPGFLAASEGGTAMTFPFSQVQIRYQQIHGDLRGDAKMLTGIGLRRDGLYTGATGVPRDLDLDLCIGHASFSAVTDEFAANYVGEPTLVIARKTVSTPDWTLAPLTPPAPFDLALAFDAPAAYSGALDLVWELKIRSNNATTGYELYVDSAVPMTSDALSLSLGLPCMATGQEYAYTLYGTIAALSHGEYRFGAQGLFAPPSSQFNFLLLGVSNPDLGYPWLCSTVHSSGEVVLPMPAADATGTWTQPSMFFPANPYFVGFELYWQAASLDSGMPGLPLALTQGRRLTLTSIPYGMHVKVKHLYELTDLGAPRAGTFADGGLVTQFTF